MRREPRRPYWQRRSCPRRCRHERDPAWTNARLEERSFPGAPWARTWPEPRERFANIKTRWTCRRSLAAGGQRSMAIFQTRVSSPAPPSRPRARSYRSYSSAPPGDRESARRWSRRAPGRRETWPTSWRTNKWSCRWPGWARVSKRFHKPARQNRTTRRTSIIPSVTGACFAIGRLGFQAQRLFRQPILQPFAPASCRASDPRSKWLRRWAGWLRPRQKPSSAYPASESEKIRRRRSRSLRRGYWWRKDRRRAGRTAQSCGQKTGSAPARSPPSKALGTPARKMTEKKAPD